MIFTFILFTGCMDVRIKNSIDLKGKWHYHVGDDPKWSSPQYDDSSWPTIQIPGTCPVGPYPLVIWYRTKFVLSRDFSNKELGIFLGIIRYADETYINGIKIGGEGKLGQRFVEADKKERLYKIPKKILHFDKPNLLAVRTNVSYVQGAILGPVLIGPYKELLQIVQKRTSLRVALEMFILGCLTIIIVTCGYLFINRLREKEYLYFGFLVFLYTVLFVLDSLFWYNLNLKSYMVQIVIIFIYTIIPSVVILFTVSAYQYQMNLVLRFLTLSFVILGFVYIIFYYNPFIYKLISLIWSILVFMSIFAIGYILIISFKTSYMDEYIPLTVGILSLFICSEIEQIHNFQIQLLNNAANFAHLGVFLFVLGTIYAFTARFSKMKQELQTFSSYIIAAQEDERKKISMELHDGICQSLIATKLQLQLLMRKFPQNDNPFLSALCRVVNELDLIIQETRGLSFNLSPVLLDRMDLSMAIRTYIDKVRILSDIKIYCDLQPLNVSDVKIAQHLYRIMQEAVTNVVRHANATELTVILKQEKNMIILCIEDNGLGFDLYKIKTQNKGIGLLSMKERVKMLGGNLEIKTRPGYGTLIRVEVRKKG